VFLYFRVILSRAFFLCSLAFFPFVVFCSHREGGEWYAMAWWRGSRGSRLSGAAVVTGNVTSPFCFDFLSLGFTNLGCNFWFWASNF